MVRHANGCGFTGLGEEILWIGFIKGSLNQRGGLRTHEERRFNGLWICDDVAVSRKRVALANVGLVVRVWSVWVTADSGLPREIEAECGIWKRIEVYIGLTRGFNRSFGIGWRRDAKTVLLSIVEVD